MSSDKLYYTALENVARGRKAQEEKRKSTPGYIPTAQNEYYLKYVNANKMLNKARMERDNARLMVDILFKTIRNIMPVYQEYIKSLNKHTETRDPHMKDKL